MTFLAAWWIFATVSTVWNLVLAVWNFATRRHMWGTILLLCVAWLACIMWLMGSVKR